MRKTNADRLSPAPPPPGCLDVKHKILLWNLRTQNRISTKKHRDSQKGTHLCGQIDIESKRLSKGVGH